MPDEKPTEEDRPIVLNWPAVGIVIVKSLFWAFVLTLLCYCHAGRLPAL